MMISYVKVNFAEIKKRVLDSGIGEDKFREECYKDNPKYKKPNNGIESLIKRIFHSPSFAFDDSESTEFESCSSSCM